MINTPAEDMMPEHIALIVKSLAKEFNAKFSEIVGDELLNNEFNAVHAVGRASSHAPRLIKLKWNHDKKDYIKISLVGKGVCFDSGGLDIKTAAGMNLMKKDMGGAAAVIAIARMIMKSNLPVNLTLIIPAVENAVSGNAFRPLDIIKTKKGITVEVTNTDAEGRLILCDALYEADIDSPDILIDMATLTGAARTALGTDVPAMFTDSDSLAAELMEKSIEEQDPMWRLPLWKPYRELLSSKVADMVNSYESPYGGAITAALFLKEFVEKTKNWVHLDTMAWNVTAKAGRPVGGEAFCVRAIYSLISEKALERHREKRSS